METPIRDLRYALRSLGRRPGFTAIAVIMLALGIGANSAIFTVVNAVLMKPLAYPAPEQLVHVQIELPRLGFARWGLSPAEYRELQTYSRSYSALGAWRTRRASVSGIEDPIQVTAAEASAELFEALGVPARLGRVYTRDEEIARREAVIVVSHRLWSSVLSADPEIIGRSVEVDGTSRTVLGVMPPGFDARDAGIDVWSPLALPDNSENRGSHFLNVVGRLGPNVDLEQVRTELRDLLARWSEFPGAADHAPNDSTHLVVATGLHDAMVANVRPMLLFLFGAVGFVLLIACANVGNLLLTKAESRQKEIAIRSALGAGRGRLAQLFLAEAALLSVGAGALGLLVGYWGLDLLLAILPNEMPRLAAIELDANVLAFTATVSIVTAVIFGLAPILHLSSASLGSTSKEGGQRVTAAGSRMRVRQALVVCQIALAVMLVIGAGLMLRTLAALQDVDPGFRPDGLLTFELFLPSGSYPDGAGRSAFLNRVVEQLEAIPGVESAAMVSGLPPLKNSNGADTRFEGREPTPDGPPHHVAYNQVVGGSYFETMGIPIVRGRAFDRRDDGEGTPVAVINERFAQVFYSGEDPVGLRIGPFWTNDPWFTIVGVAADVKQAGLNETVDTELYLHYPQTAAHGYGAPRMMNVVVRTTRDPLAFAGVVRGAVHELDASLAIAGFQTMEQNVVESIGRPRFVAVLLTVFGVVALGLAAIGTFGVFSYSVAQRTRELGIRMALGAGADAVRDMVLWQGGTIAVVGLGTGLLGALGLTRLMSGLLFGISSVDPFTFVASPVILALVALAACYLPARRATKVDPMIVLKAE